MLIILLLLLLLLLIVLLVNYFDSFELANVNYFGRPPAIGQSLEDLALCVRLRRRLLVVRTWLAFKLNWRAHRQLLVCWPELVRA